MTSSLRLRTSRLLLALMLLTFLSPGFGWQVVAGHDLLAHAAAEAHGHGHDDHDHDHDHHGAVLAGGTAAHDHEDAHSMIGHVLSHMPAAAVSAALTPQLPYQPVMQGLDPSLVMPASPPDQPYRPPQALLV
jgi:hypothetical protein